MSARAGGALNEATSRRSRSPESRLVLARPTRAGAANERATTGRRPATDHPSAIGQRQKPALAVAAIGERQQEDGAKKKQLLVNGKGQNKDIFWPKAPPVAGAHQH